MNMTSTMIEFSELAGQKSIAYGTRLPKRCNHFCEDVMKMTEHIERPSSFVQNEEWDAYMAEVNAINEAYTLMRYRRLGIDIVAEVDELFYEVVLPDGWQVESDYSSAYWSYIIDENDECVGNIFYKAVFYDREAFIHFNDDYGSSEE